MQLPGSSHLALAVVGARLGGGAAVTEIVGISSSVAKSGDGDVGMALCLAQLVVLVALVRVCGGHQ